MTPSITDYLRGLRRFWWIPVLSLLIGGALGIFAATAKPSITTNNLVLFTFTATDKGVDPAYPSGSTQTDVGTQRLSAYLRVAMASQPVRDLLAEHGITASSGGDRVVTNATPGGVVEIQLANEGLSQEEGIALTKSFADELAAAVIKTDSSQATPILAPNPVVTTPQAVTGSLSMLKLGLPIALMLIVGVVAVYVIVWAQGRIWTGRDIEDRLEARLIGEADGKASDGLALALALVKDREASTRALLVPIGATAEGKIGALSQLIADSWSARKHPANTSTAAETATSPSTPTPPDAADLLDVVVADKGLDADALQAAASVDVVALVIGYGDGRYRDLTAAGRTLSRVTDAEIAVIGLTKRNR
ncbi:MAG: hypothetical protein LWW77_00735 [Propionibacteriales bacterium]|nr:hypothetical protein [Propionibacteriales bacterium]